MSSLDLSTDQSCFPEGGATDQDCGFFPWPQTPGLYSIPAPCLPELALIAPFRIYTQGACCRVGREVELELGKLGMLTVQLEGSLGKVFPAAHESASYWSSKCSQQKLHPFNAL